MNRLSQGRIDGWEKELQTIHTGLVFGQGEDWTWDKEDAARAEFMNAELGKLRSGETPLMVPNDLRDKVKLLIENRQARGRFAPRVVRTLHSVVLGKEILAVRAILARYAELND